MSFKNGRSAERNSLMGFNRHRFAGFRIAADPFSPGADREDTKARQLHILAYCECFTDCSNNLIHQLGGVVRCYINLPIYGLHQIGSDHVLSRHQHTPRYTLSATKSAAVASDQSYRRPSSAVALTSLRGRPAANAGPLEGGADEAYLEGNRNDSSPWCARGAN